MLLSFGALGHLYSVVLGALCVGEVTARLESSRRLSCLDDAFFYLSGQLLARGSGNMGRDA